MHNTRYTEITDLSDWQDDDATVLVHVFAGSLARVRSHFPNRQSAVQTLHSALEEANRFVFQDADKSRVAIYLDEDATWDDRLGSLMK